MRVAPIRKRITLSLIELSGIGLAFYDAILGAWDATPPFRRCSIADDCVCCHTLDICVTWTLRTGMTILTYGTVLSSMLYGIYEYFGVPRMSRARRVFSTCIHTVSACLHRTWSGSLHDGESKSLGWNHCI